MSRNGDREMGEEESRRGIEGERNGTEWKERREINDGKMRIINGRGERRI